MDPAIPPERRPPILVDFGWAFLREWWVDPTPAGAHLGAGFRTLAGLWAWFSDDERCRLSALGYLPVRMIAEALSWNHNIS